MAEENNSPAESQQPEPMHPDVKLMAGDLDSDNLLQQFNPEDNILESPEEFTGMLDISDSKFINDKTASEAATAKVIATQGITLP